MHVRAAEAKDGTGDVWERIYWSNTNCSQKEKAISPVRGNISHYICGLFICKSSEEVRKHIVRMVGTCDNAYAPFFLSSFPA